MNTLRDYAADYLAARRVVRAPDVTDAARDAARIDAERVDFAARCAGVDLDIVSLDELARLEHYGLRRDGRHVRPTADGWADFATGALLDFDAVNALGLDATMRSM